MPPLRKPLALASALILSALGAGACGRAAKQRPGFARGVIEVSYGRYGNLHLGQADGDVIAVAGPGIKQSPSPFLSPTSAPPYTPTDSSRDIIYPDASVTSRGGRVTAISVYGIGAHTGSGLTIGESFQEAAYGTHAVCQPARGGPDPRDPACESRVRPGLYLYFAGDPVAVITMSIEPEFAS